MGSKEKVNLKMLTRDYILSTLKNNKSFFQKELGVKKIGLFGSYAKGTQQSDSDVDIFVEMEENSYHELIKLLLFLEQKFQRKVDLIHKHKLIRASFLQTLERETLYA